MTPSVREVCEEFARGDVGENTAPRKIQRAWLLADAWGLFARLAVIMAGMVLLAAVLSRCGPEEPDVCSDAPAEYQAICNLLGRCIWCPVPPHGRRYPERVYAGR